MKFEDFETLIETYGADPQRWPEPKREDMQRIIQAHPEQTNAVLNAARTLDDMLDAVPSVQASDLLKSRIQRTTLAAMPVSRNEIPRNETPQKQPFSGWARLAAMITVSFSAGFAGAQFVELTGTGETKPVEWVASVDTHEDESWAVVATELGFSEIYEWTSGENIDVTMSDL